ncbi:sulfurtransferase [Crocosphaera sp. UHCC 0190]|uniref:sulfurtransferase n=1 Tax=Crocosphaera sp. UHCC 0190 TaxID=3110246 RepID=UPI002B2153ED|nr:sulfurtransferase [Crocosphaera sp. UHCC 0190]MEA5508147.1 sulfurtransferase [Crocosphaera sp. UHCC 0190]
MFKLDSVVSGQWLAGQLTHSNLVIVDCRFRLGNPDWGYEQYLTRHIQGAYYLNLDSDLSSPVTQHGGRHPLPDLSLFAEKLAGMGITLGETLVVAYDDLRLAFAARFWWLLRYLGHEQVAVLDGGWTAWENQGYPTSNVIPEAKLGQFVPQPCHDWIVDMEGVKHRKIQPQTRLIDSRDGDRYRGEIEPIDPIAGHIPGAINSPWKQVTDEQGYILPVTAQQGLWETCSTAEEIIVYCGSGVTACVNLLSMELAGIHGAKLYPGGWSDWCSYLV